jgi:3-phenylpropionate/trans-cinnamate dioxygenase ferredoxin reductase subunit
MPRLRRPDSPTLPREAIGKRSRRGDAKTDMTRVHSLDQTFVIVGAGLAGAKAAETLRAEGFDGRVIMIGAEAERPYERPPLSKEYLRGEVGREKVYVHDGELYAANEIELRLGRTAVGLDASIGEVALDDGERMRYDRLLLATGAEPRRLSVPGHALDRVLYLRDVRGSDVPLEDLVLGTEAGAA